MSDQPRRLVAVVDDDPRVLESLQDLLESAGYAVQTHSSAGALLSTGIADIDCLITDICMPVIDGFELRDRVRQARPELPVFLISARRDLADAGDGDIFPKPFDGPTLLAAIARALHDSQD